MNKMARSRCFGDGDPLMTAYHDDEWGVPVHDDRRLFQKLILDGFQAGLSWRTILHKREHFIHAFAGFDAERMARFGEEEIARLLADPGIVRNRLKVRSAVSNAQVLLEHFSTPGSFDRFLWSFVDGQTVYGPPARTWAELPTSSLQSEAMSKALKQLGFKFAGTTICYAFMQAVGMVDDHLLDCFRFKPR